MSDQQNGPDAKSSFAKPTVDRLEPPRYLPSYGEGAVVRISNFANFEFYDVVAVVFKSPNGVHRFQLEEHTYSNNNPIVSRVDGATLIEKRKQSAEWDVFYYIKRNGVAHYSAAQAVYLGRILPNKVEVDTYADVSPADSVAAQDAQTP